MSRLLRLTNSDTCGQFAGVAFEMTSELVVIAEFSGATRRIRTDDLLITKEFHCQILVARDTDVFQKAQQTLGLSLTVG